MFRTIKNALLLGQILWQEWYSTYLYHCSNWKKYAINLGICYKEFCSNLSILLPYKTFIWLKLNELGFHCMKYFNHVEPYSNSHFFIFKFFLLDNGDIDSTTCFFLLQVLKCNISLESFNFPYCNESGLALLNNNINQNTVIV